MSPCADLRGSRGNTAGQRGSYPVTSPPQRVPARGQLQVGGIYLESRDIKHRLHITISTMFVQVDHLWPARVRGPPVLAQLQSGGEQKLRLRFRVHLGQLHNSWFR